MKPLLITTLILLQSLPALAGFGAVFQQPFKATIQVRQLCYEENLYGCNANDLPGLDANFRDGGGRKRRHLLKTDADGNTYVTHEEEVVETGRSNQLDATTSWIFQGSITEEGVQYNRFVARFDDMTQSFPGPQAWAKATHLVEAGIIPDVYEYLEATQSGTPFAIRMYSSRNQKRMYSETKFLSVTALNEIEVASAMATLSRVRADENKDKGRKLQRQTKSAVAADIKKDYGIHLPRRTNTVTSGLMVPLGCTWDAKSYFCFALSKAEDEDTGGKNIALNMAMKSPEDANQNADIFGRIVLGSKDQLLYADGRAQGCASPTSIRVGNLTKVGVKVCVDGEMKFSADAPQDATGFDLNATIAFGGDSETLDLVGGGIRVAAGGRDDRTLAFQSLNGHVYSSLEHDALRVEAAVALDSSPRDYVGADDWMANLFFVQAIGIDLWLWRQEARRSFKIGQVGPQRLQANYDPLIELPVDLTTSVCMQKVEEHGNGYLLVKLQLPGGLGAGSGMTFEDGQRALDKFGFCYRVAWASLEYTCDSSGQWMQSGGQFITPAEPTDSCVDVNPDLEFVEAMDIAGCAASQVPHRFGPISVTFDLPSEEVAGSVVSIDAGYAYRGIQDLCYSVTWGDHEFTCGDDGQWVQTSGTWETNTERQCQDGEEYVSNGKQPYLEVNNGLDVTCLSTTFEWSNHPLYVKVALPEGKPGISTIQLDHGSAGRKVGKTCSWIEWIPLVFECKEDTLEWTLVQGYLRSRPPLSCDRWAEGYGYTNNGKQEHLEVVDTTFLMGCPPKQVAYGTGPLQVIFDLPGNKLRGDTLEFTEGQVNRGNCHSIGWSARAFVCEPFTGEWKQTMGEDPHVQDVTEGCTSSSMFAMNGDQPFLVINDGTSDANAIPFTPSPIGLTFTSPPVTPITMTPTEAPSTIMPWIVPAGDTMSPPPSTALPVVTNNPTTLPAQTTTQPEVTASAPTLSPALALTPMPLAPTSPRPTFPQAQESTSFCGCPLCDKAQWDTVAGTFTCGARIIWVLNGGTPILEACHFVATTEDACVACDPETCDKTATSMPSAMPSDLPTTKAPSPVPSNPPTTSLPLTSVIISGPVTSSAPTGEQSGQGNGTEEVLDGIPSVMQTEHPSMPPAAAFSNDAAYSNDVAFSNDAALGNDTSTVFPETIQEEGPLPVLRGIPTEPPVTMMENLTGWAPTGEVATDVAAAVSAATLVPYLPLATVLSLLTSFLVNLL